MGDGSDTERGNEEVGNFSPLKFSSSSSSKKKKEEDQSEKERERQNNRVKERERERETVFAEKDEQDRQMARNGQKRREQMGLVRRVSARGQEGDVVTGIERSFLEADVTSAKAQSRKKDVISVVYIFLFARRSVVLSSSRTRSFQHLFSSSLNATIVSTQRTTSVSINSVCVCVCMCARPRVCVCVCRLN